MALPSLGIDSQFALLGEPALFQPAGDVPAVRPMVAIWRRPLQGDAFSEQKFVQERVTAEIRLSELPAVAEGDQLRLGGNWYTISAAPETEPERKIWRLQLTPSPD
jgi:hypothetical protein